MRRPEYRVHPSIEGVLRSEVPHLPGHPLPNMPQHHAGASENPRSLLVHRTRLAGYDDQGSPYAWHGFDRPQTTCGVGLLWRAQSSHPGVLHQVPRALQSRLHPLHDLWANPVGPIRLPNGLEMSRPASASILHQTRFAAAGRVGSIERLCEKSGVNHGRWDGPVCLQGGQGCTTSEDPTENS